jgi:hypothetical protein
VQTFFYLLSAKKEQVNQQPLFFFNSKGENVVLKKTCWQHGTGNVVAINSQKNRQ